MLHAENADMRSFLTSERFTRLVLAVLPLAFIGSGFLNSIAFAVGLQAHDTVRVLFTFGLLGLAALILLARLFGIALTSAESRPLLLRTLWIPVIFSVLYLVAFFTTSMRLTVLKNAITNGLYLILGCSAILILYLERCLPAILRALRIYATITAPLYLYYCVRFYVSSPDFQLNNLGTMDYMSIAYFALGLLICLGVEILLSEQLNLPKHIAWNLSLYLLYSAVISLSGTKGAILCALFLSFVFLVYGCFYMKSRKKLLLSFVSSALLVLVLFFTVLCPNPRGNRVFSFVGELSNGKSSEEIFEVVFSAEEILCDIFIAEGQPPAVTPSDIISYYKSGQADEALASGILTEEAYQTIYSACQALNHTGSGYRKFLWMAALQEIKASPLVGHGPMAFQDKYGTYPHNLILEIGTDFGLIAVGLVALLALIVFFRLIPLTGKRPYLAAFAIYVLAFLPQHAVSGSLYGNAVFVQYGMWILLTAWLVPPRFKKGKPASALQHST